MTNQHPITPPPELIEEWTSMLEYHPDEKVFSEVAQWGADQELDACCEWNSWRYSKTIAKQLRVARRRKPPSLKEQALEALKDIECEYVIGATTSTIRRALEALPND